MRVGCGVALRYSSCHCLRGRFTLSLCGDGTSPVRTRRHSPARPSTHSSTAASISPRCSCGGWRSSRYAGTAELRDRSWSSSAPWYHSQSAGAALWHLTTLEDQQLAGLIMWIPAGFVYLIALLAVLRRVFDVPAPSKLAGGVAAAIVFFVATSMSGGARAPGDPMATGTVGQPLADIAAYLYTLH